MLWSGTKRVLELLDRASEVEVRAEVNKGEKAGTTQPPVTTAWKAR